MVKRMLGMVACVLLLLGCSPGESAMDEALAFRAGIQGACSFRAEITADYGQEVRRFTLDCEDPGDGSLRFTVVAPESISGITGTLNAVGGTLTYDGAMLGFGSLADGQLNPISAPMALLSSWRTGYIRACGREDGSLRMTVDAALESNPLTVDTWLTSDGSIPFYGEISYKNLCILSAAITNFES